MPLEPERITEQIFPALIQVSRPPNAEALNQQLLAEVESIRATTPNGKPENWSCDVYTTMTNAGRLHNRPSFREFTDFSISCANYFSEVMCYSYGEDVLDMKECWFNIYGPGHSQEVHCHPNHAMTGVYYLKAPPGSAALVFHSPYHKSMMRPERTEDTFANSPAIPYPPTEGDLVMFDSAIKHSVPLHTLDEERISISFNIGLGPADDPR